jgi:phospholipase/lecithinase/hemolysin
MAAGICWACRHPRATVPPARFTFWLPIRDFDVFQTANPFTVAPGMFGLSVVDAPCVTPNVAPFHCDAPDEYLFWDGVHPTRAVHGLLAEAAADRVWQP